MSEDSHKQINQLLTKLITSQLEIVNPNDPKINEVLSYLGRVLNLISMYKTPEDSQAQQLLHKQLLRIHDDSNQNTGSSQTSTLNSSALRVQELVTRFYRTRSCKNQNDILYLLSKLSGSNPLNSEKKEKGNFESIFKPQKNILNSTMEIENLSLVNTTTHSMNATMNQQHGGRGNKNFDESSNNLKLTIKSVTDQGNPKVDMTEKDLVRDLLFTFQGIDGHFISYNGHQDAFLLKANIPIAQPVRELVNRLCELGWLFKKINEFLSKESLGLIRQSLVLALKEELNQYYRLIAILENLKNSGNENNGTSFISNNNKSMEILEAPATSNENSLSLRKLVLWTLEPLERLRWLSIICQSVKNLHGCNIISGINSFGNQGNPAIQNLIQRILGHVLAPLLKLINSWVFTGQLFDSQKEFFIQQDPDVPERDLWRSRYTLVVSLIPNILDRTLAQKIYTIGKSVNFLRQNCSYSEWQLTMNPLSSISSSVSNPITIGMINEQEQLTMINSSKLLNDSCHDIKVWVNTAFEKTNVVLMEVLTNKFKLKQHLTSIKSYLLMGQGDFIQSLMDHLLIELFKPALTIQRNQLLGILETAIRSSNAQFHSPESLSRVDIKLLEASPGDKGWDIFSLDYHVDPPISTILSPQTMKQYLRIFNFLWRVRRVDYSLCEVWMLHMKNQHISRDFKNLREQFLKCNLLRNEMHHFVTNFFNYIMLQAIETAWKGFIQNFQKASDLEELISAHEKFVNEVLQKALLTPKSENIYRQLTQIFDLIFRFQYTQDILIQNAIDQHTRHRQLVEQRKIAKRLGEHLDGDSDSEMVDDSSEMDGGRPGDNSQQASFNETSKHLRDIAQDYRQSFQEFYILLKRDEKLRFLSFKLDFNEFYSAKRIPLNLNLDDIRKIGGMDGGGGNYSGMSKPNNNNNNNFPTSSSNPFGSNNSNSMMGGPTSNAFNLRPGSTAFTGFNQNNDIAFQNMLSNNPVQPSLNQNNAFGSSGNVLNSKNLAPSMLLNNNSSGLTNNINLTQNSMMNNNNNNTNNTNALTNNMNFSLGSGISGAGSNNLLSGSGPSSNLGRTKTNNYFRDSSPGSGLSGVSNSNTALGNNLTLKPSMLQEDLRKNEFSIGGNGFKNNGGGTNLISGGLFVNPSGSGLPTNTSKQNNLMPSIFKHQDEGDVLGKNQFDISNKKSPFNPNYQKIGVEEEQSDDFYNNKRDHDQDNEDEDDM